MNFENFFFCVPKMTKLLRLNFSTAFWVFVFVFVITGCSERNQRDCIAPVSVKLVLMIISSRKTSIKKSQNIIELHFPTISWIIFQLMHIKFLHNKAWPILNNFLFNACSREKLHCFLKTNMFSYYCNFWSLSKLISMMKDVKVVFLILFLSWFWFTKLINE